MVSYAPIKTRFNDKYDELQKAKQIQFEQTGYVTFDKGLLRKIAISAVFTWTDAGYLQAVELKKPDLAKALDKDPSWLEKCSENVFTGRAKELITFLDSNPGTLTVITPAAVTEMNDALKNFEDVAAMPKSIIKTKKAQGTDTIPLLFKDFNEIKKQIKKFIRTKFQVYLSTWNSINKIGESSAVRHTSLALQFRADGTDLKLKNVKCSLTNGSETHTAISTIMGWVRFYSLITDKWTATCELTTYETFTLSDIETYDNHVEKHIVSLKKLPLSEGDTDPETTTGILSLIAYDKETGEPLAGATNSIPALNHSNTTDEDGEDYADGAEPGNYQGTLFFEGKKPLNNTFTIEAGKTTTLQLYMENETV
jgi:hypothetical protein